MNKLYSEVTYRRALRRKDDNELYDCQAPPPTSHRQPKFALPAHDVMKLAREPSDDWAKALEVPVAGDFDEGDDRLIGDTGDRVVGGGRVLKDLPGAGRVYDWRDSSWTPTNGGPIKPLVFVQHIPVVPNVSGIADFVRLRDVLVAQGLMIHTATDREGNVALYTPFNYLNYQARGANSFSCGCEHMHMTTGEDWTEKQLRAAAWVVNLAKNKHDIPAGTGELGSGNGVVRVLDEGQVSHQRVSQAAGYNDRSDPGRGYDFGHVRELVIWWREHSSFVGAPTN
jgi:hypothetical protein